MNKRIIYIFSFFIFLAFLFGIVYLSNQKKQRSKSDYSKIKVAASIFPLYDIVRNIGGESLAVELVLPVGASPHTYDVSPADIKKLQGSRVLFIIDHGVDNWIVELAKNTGVEQVVIVDKEISLLSDDNPHYWLSYENAKHIAETVTQTLEELDPAHKESYVKNKKRFVSDLDSTVTVLQNELNSLPTKNIATFHDAWPYFARDFGIKITAVFEEFPGKEPTPRYLYEFQERIKRDNVKVIFSEPQFAGDILESTARDLGVKLSFLDPIGGIEGRKSYIELIQFNVSQIIKSLK